MSYFLDYYYTIIGLSIRKLAIFLIERDAIKRARSIAFCILFLGDWFCNSVTGWR